MSQFKKQFIFCPVCDKKIIERLPNGLFRFIFGSKRSTDGTEWETPPVHIEIHGSLRMNCLRKTCNHVLILNYFPNSENISPNLEIAVQSESPKSD